MFLRWLGDGKRERAAARLDIVSMASGNKSYTPKTDEVIAWLKRKSLKDLGITVSQSDLYADELSDLVAINSMWSESTRRK